MACGNVDTKQIPHHIRKTKNFALFVGVLRWYKGLDILLSAAKNISNPIIIVGKGPLFLKLQQRLKKEQISNVILLGYIEDATLKYLYEKCLFTILPSTSPAEAFGQVLLESCYFKKPMITTTLGTATSFVNKNKKTGLTIPPNDSEALGNAMSELFNDKLLCQRYGKNAYHRYKSHFSMEKQAPKYIRLYKKLAIKI